MGKVLWNGKAVDASTAELARLSLGIADRASQSLEDRAFCALNWIFTAGRKFR